MCARKTMVPSKTMMERKLKCELYNDSMQGWKGYPIQKAQLVIADIPYNVGTNFYGSNPQWYNGGEHIKTGKANWPGKRPSRATGISTSTSISTFAAA